VDLSARWSCRVRILLWFRRYPSFRRLTSCDSLATETEYVRQRLAEYANDLLSLGVDGLRLDASKRTP
jgi:glycosidase